MARENKATKEQIEDLYCLEGLSLRKVASILKIATDTLTKYMNLYNVKTRNLSQSHIAVIGYWKGRKKGFAPKTSFKKGSVPWNRGLTAKDDPRIIHGHKFTLGHTPWNKGKNKYNSEMYKKMSLKRSGENHWMWKGGITPERHKIYTSLKYKLWRKSVFERDNYTCQMCSITCTALEAHHKHRFSDYKDKRFDIDNGITLCKKCHAGLGKKHTTPKNHMEVINVSRKFIL